ncbi:sugar ABC transporter substrate-binding protein [Bacteroidia bacterium]|nr:sugar ABC transporter substrate-binding protein [Bacteroidia bacterium]
MKKRISILLIAVMIIGMTACGKASNNVDAATGTPAADSSNLIVYTQKTMNQYFHVALQEKVEEAVATAGYVSEVANCNNDSTLQNDQMKNFISKKPKAIIGNTVDSDALNDVVDAAVKAGIPVIMVDNPASTAVVDGTVQFDNFQCGKMAAEEIVAKLTEKYGSPKGRVVNVYGAMSSECWRLRKDGFDSVIKEYPDIEYIEVPGEGERAKSQEALTNVIAKYSGEIDAVHCPSDDPGLGCAEALRIANLWYPVGDEKHVIIVTGDGEPDAVKYLQDGYYDAIIVEDAYAYGPIAVDLLTQYIFKGEKVPTTGTYTNEAFYWKTAEFMDGPTGPILRVPPYALTSENVKEEGHWGVQALKDSAK